MLRLYGHGIVAFLSSRAAGRPVLLPTVVGTAARDELEQSLLIYPVIQLPASGQTRGPVCRREARWPSSCRRTSAPVTAARTLAGTASSHTEEQEPRPTTRT